MNESHWQAQMDFLTTYPELHSLLAAYIAIEDDHQQACLQLFRQENPRALSKLTEQLAQLIEQGDAQQQRLAVTLAGHNLPAQQVPAWLIQLQADLLQTNHSHPDRVEVTQP
jgi:hypothetical protein